jgi:hypothetical protein
MFIEGSESICKTITNSPDIKSIFNRCQQAMMVDGAMSSKVRDLQSAKSRFSSTQRPLGRFILFFPAVVATASELQVRRSDVMGKRGRDFLQEIDEESLILLAMMADAGDEAARVVRFFDTKDHDIAETLQVLGRFLHNIDCLFLRRGCLELRTDNDSRPGTYTAYALDLLNSASQLVFYSGRQTVRKNLGGPGAITPEILDSCIARLAAWVRLTSATVRAEFPDWDVISAFNAFSLKVDPDSPKANAFIAKCLERLAKTFNVDSRALMLQFTDFRKFALVKHKTGLNNFDSWKASVLQLSPQARSHHERGALFHVLARYGAFIGASTSCVERTFSAVQHTAGLLRGSLSPGALEHDLRLKLLPIPQTACAEQTALCQKAAKVWLATYGRPRASPRDRWISGLGTRTRSSTSMEVTFIKGRQAAVADLGRRSAKRSLDEIEQDAAASSLAVWGENHDKARHLDSSNVVRTVAGCFGFEGAHQLLLAMAGAAEAEHPGR